MQHEQRSQHQPSFFSFKHFLLSSHTGANRMHGFFSLNK
jgi:hypothetical protein